MTDERADGDDEMVRVTVRMPRDMKLWLDQRSENRSATMRRAVALLAAQADALDAIVEDDPRPPEVRDG